MSIDLLVKENKSFSSEIYWAKCFQKALKNEGIEAPIISLQCSMRHYLQKLNRNPPRWMFSFSDLLGFKKPLSDLFKVPQFLWKMDGGFSQCAHILESDWTYLGLGDSYLVRKLNHERVFALPPAIEPFSSESCDPLFETVLFEPLIDSERKKMLYSSLFGQDVQSAVFSKLKQTLKHPIDRIKEKPLKTELSINDWIYALEESGKARKIQDLISSFSTPLHVFGEHVGAKWYKRLPNSQWIHLHSALPFLEHFEVLRRSHFLVIDCWEKEEGYPFWFLVAASCGALPLIPYSKSRESLIEDLPIVYRSLEELKERILILRENKQLRRSLVLDLKTKVEKMFSWDVLTKQLCERLYAI